MACALAYSIFGFNIVFCKDIANSSVISPEALFCIRMIGASLIFWLISIFVRKEKMPLSDIVKTALASFLGLTLPQYTFLKAITMTSSIETSVIGSLSPIFTMFVAAIFLKEPITWKKAGGVVCSFTGIIALIFSSSINGHSGNINIVGLSLLLLNCVSFAMYLGIFRPLIQRYNVITFMKWMFTFSLIISLPFSISPLVNTQWNLLTFRTIEEIGFLVVFATIVAYTLIPLGQARIRPTIVSMYTYLQPIIAVTFSVLAGMDVMTVRKAVYIFLVFLGVFIVNQSRSAKPSLHR